LIFLYSGKTVDTLLEPNLVPASPKNRDGRPCVEGRRRIVLYLDESQVRNLKLHAVEEDTDVSTIARAALKKAAFLRSAEGDSH
jgi:hypothetical protein